MQTFRAYLQDAAGKLTWAAWIEAADAQEAEGRARALCDGGIPAVDLWSATERGPDPKSVLEPV